MHGHGVTSTAGILEQNGVERETTWKMKIGEEEAKYGRDEGMK